MSATSPAGGVPPGAPARPDDDARLHKASRQLEGVFFAQVFASMRATVEPDSLLGTAPGQDVFDAMLGETLADKAAARTTHGLSETLYRQLSGRRGDAPPAGPR
jgi:Rod binding domain-containing protein